MTNHKAAFTRWYHEWVRHRQTPDALTQAAMVAAFLGGYDAALQTLASVFKKLHTEDELHQLVRDLESRVNPLETFLKVLRDE